MTRPNLKARYAEIAQSVRAVRGALNAATPAATSRIARFGVHAKAPSCTLLHVLRAVTCQAPILHSVDNLSV